MLYRLYDVLYVIISLYSVEKKKEKKDSSSLHNSTTIDIANNQLLSQNIEHKGRP